ncbi:MAG: pyridoxal-phosphate dependent enzyme [Anaerolineaceae bacterium]|nr:pyridoxal-phosphate dependent enzyme [Anaerolineaceae bacterium]
MKDFGIYLRDVYRAKHTISHIIQETPLIQSKILSEITGSKVALKLENVQQTGSFKLRGTANKLLNLSNEQRDHGVITVSSGNHGRAISFLAQQMGIPAVIGLGVNVPSNKVKAIQQYGAETLIIGDNYEETSLHADRLREERGLININPFDDPFILSGQGTISLEILAKNPKIDTILVPLSGGGLAGGVALAAKTIHPHIHIIGVSMEGSPVMVRSIQAGKIIEMQEVFTLADGLLGGIGLDNRYSFEICRNLLDETILVTEEEIGKAIVFLLEEHRLIVEGAGAVGVAALLNSKGILGENTAVILSGGNIKLPVLLDLIQKYGKDS